jgi:hypothetical protein
MKLWVDDLRSPPDSTWHWVLTVEDALTCIRRSTISEIAFDHDLGTGGEAYNIAVYIEEGAYFKMLPRMKWSIHSANPVGAQKIRIAMERAERYWNE